MAYHIFFSKFLEKGRWNQENRSLFIEKLNKYISFVIFHGLIIRKEDRGKYVFLEVVDEFGKYELRSFDKQVVSQLHEGDLIVGIGTLRKYKDTIYILPRVINKTDFEDMILFNTLSLKKLVSRFKFLEDIKGKIEENKTSEVTISAKKFSEEKEVENFAEIEITPKSIIEIIRQYDKGEGVSYDFLLQQFSEKERKKVEEIIQQLLLSGSLYEPSPGKIKVLE